MRTGYTVADAMTQEPIFVEPDTAVQACAEMMKSYKIGAILVKDGKDIVGICTERDMVYHIIAEGKSINTPIKDIMSSSVRTIEPDKDIFEALMRMRDLNIRRLPVVQHGEFVGLLTLKDVLKIEPQLFDMLVDKMEVREMESKPVKVRETSDGDAEVDALIRG